MDEAVINRLIEINRQFYDEFGAAFAETRRRVQDGVKRALAEIPDQPGSWLDLGCGSGALAAAWLRSGRLSKYTGLDFSVPLLSEARTAVQNLPGAERIDLKAANLVEPGWADGLKTQYDGVLAFAVLHHIPSNALRERLISKIYALLKPGGLFVFSVWQFHNSPKLTARALAWESVGLTDDLLEPGDTLLDWRHALPSQESRVGLRYVHRFTSDELKELAERSGFFVQGEYESDGKGGRLGLYQIWYKPPNEG